MEPRIAFRCFSLVLCAALATPAIAQADVEYSRRHGVGIYHDAEVHLGLFAATIPDNTPVGDMMLPDGDATTGKAGASIHVEGVFLGLPSVYGNFHGIEGFANAVLGPWDFNMGIGMPVTFFNIGSGGLGTMRVGGSFGFGLGKEHAFGYVKGRIAGVVWPKMVDGELQVKWTPSTASKTWSGPGNLEELTIRASGWVRLSEDGRPWEVYLESYERERRDFGPETSLANQRDGNVRAFSIGAGMAF